MERDYVRYPVSNNNNTGELDNNNGVHYSRKRPFHNAQGGVTGGAMSMSKAPSGRFSHESRQEHRRQDFVGHYGPRGQAAVAAQYNGGHEEFNAIKQQQQQGPARSVPGRVDRNGQQSNGNALSSAPQRPPPPTPFLQQQQQHNHSDNHKWGSNNMSQEPRRTEPGSFGQQGTQRLPNVRQQIEGNNMRPLLSWEQNNRNGPSQGHHNVHSSHEWNRNNVVASDGRQSSSVGSSASDSSRGIIWVDRRRQGGNTAPPPPPPPRLQPDDSRQIHTLRWQPGSGNNAGGKTNQPLPMARNGQHGPPPPPPPRNSPPQWNRSGRSASSGHVYHGNVHRNNGEPGHKRPRLHGSPPAMMQQRRDSTNLGTRWQPNNGHQVNRSEPQKLAPLPAVEDEEKKRAFAGRFVPKGGTSESFEKLRSKKERSTYTTDEWSSNESNGGTALVELETNGSSKVVEDAAILHGDNMEEASAFVDVAENGSKTSLTESAPTDVEKVVVKLPQSLELQKHSLKDIVSDTIAPELTEVSTETDLKTAASYSSCSLAPPSNGSPSVEVIESPHSLTHADDDEVLDSEPPNKDKKLAARVIIDVPVDGLSPERVRETELNGIKGTEMKVAPKEVVVSDESVAGKETVAPASDAADVGNVASLEFARGEATTGGSDQENGEKAVAQNGILQGDSSDSDSSDDETDEEELQAWAIRMFGIPPPIAVPARSGQALPSSDSSEDDSDDEDEISSRLTIHLKLPPRKIPNKPRRRRKSLLAPRKKRKGPRKVKATAEQIARKKEEEDEMHIAEEAKRKKEEAKPLTAAEVRRILAEDKGCAAPSSHWVRRSMRQPSRSVLHNPSVRSLVDKLRVNDYDMTVLKMKKYCSDPDTPTMVIDAALDALEENTNCQALYIQNFNEGMRDEQVLHLLRILQMPSCKIWCLNIGETYNVRSKTWKLFAKGLKKTKVTHMYASEHTISNDLKDEIRTTIRKNRSKHDMHCNPDNLDVIVQCTHCWWNPINTKSLRPYLSKRGMEHILHDKEAQGLPGSMSLPATGDTAGTD